MNMNERDFLFNGWTLPVEFNYLFVQLFVFLLQKPNLFIELRDCLCLRFGIQ